jgi:hypothetical protein
MTKTIIAYDDNLGLPANLASDLNCTVCAYHDLAKLLKDFEETENMQAIFVPAGTLLYIKNYHILAQSLIGPLKTLKSNLVSLQNLDVQTINNNTLGRVNQYCTTSFWAPLLFLKNILARQTQLNFINTLSFPDMLHKTATSLIDCSMVWDAILRQCPDDTSKVKVLGSYEELPTPLILSKRENEMLKSKFIKFISTDNKGYFSGFAEPDNNLINNFVTNIKSVSNYFVISAK